MVELIVLPGLLLAILFSNLVLFRWAITSTYSTDRHRVDKEDQR